MFSKGEDGDRRHVPEQRHAPGQNLVLWRTLMDKFIINSVSNIFTSVIHPVRIVACVHRLMGVIMEEHSIQECKARGFFLPSSF